MSIRTFLRTISRQAGKGHVSAGAVLVVMADADGVERVRGRLG